MNPFPLAASALLLAALLPAPASAAEGITAAEIASKLSAARQDGNSYVRLRMDMGNKSVLQVQIKQRATRSGTDLVYQVLWPKERKGESVLLRKQGGRAASGSIFVPPNTVKSIDASDLREGLFGSDLAYEDVIDNFFAWDQQTLKGSEDVGRVNCAILESKPGKGEHSSYGSVRTWVDTRRMVPLKVEKYSSSGQLVRRIVTTRVVNDDGGAIPANLTVTGPRGGSTELDGSKIKHDVSYTDRDFSPEGLREVATP